MLYGADLVPVGEDQLPHIELTREIVRKFNGLYGEVLVEPDARTTHTPRLPGTDGRKMSKSYNNTLPLAASREELSTKIARMVTDPARARRRDPGNPDVCPVYSLHKCFTGSDRLEAIAKGCRTAELGCVDCKKELSANLAAELAPIQEKRADLINRPDTLRDILRDGAQRARAVASTTLAAARAAMGLGQHV